MTASLWLRDVGAFGLQVALVVAAGAALARAFRIHNPKAMLAFWQALLVACLLLPLGQPWRSVVPPTLDAPVLAVIADPAAAAPETPMRMAWTPIARPLEELPLLMLAAGVAARAIWLTMGACALRRLRRDAWLLEPLPATIRHAQERVGTSARICVSDRTAGPITFGLIHPVVVFPPSVQTMPSHVQEAITYHELLHVRRRDWVYGILEEVVRTVFWFHPAIWWLIGRIQLSREQVVDQAAIRLTDSRERYVDALLTVALDQSPMALAPASPFLRRSLLKKRVAQILQETTMSTRRLVASLTVSAAALALAATVAVRSFPLQAQGRESAAPSSQESGAAPIQIVKGGNNLLHAAMPEYPRRAIEQKVEGEVALDLTVDERGEVSDARVLSGPEELRRAALESALQWHYSPAALRSTSTVAILRFRLPVEGANAELGDRAFRYEVKRSEAEPEKGELSPAQQTERRIDEIKRALEDPGTTDAQRSELKQKYAEANEMMAKIRAERGEPTERGIAVTTEGRTAFVLAETENRPIQGTPRLAQIRTERVSQATMQELLAQAGVKVGDPITEDTAKRIREIASSIDEHLRVSFGSDGKGGIVLAIIAP